MSILSLIISAAVVVVLAITTYYVVKSAIHSRKAIFGYDECPFCESHCLKISFRRWGFALYEYNVTCNVCGAELDYKSGLRADQLVDLIRKAREFGYAVDIDRAIIRYFTRG